MNNQTESNPPSLDIFNLRNEVIEDYRRYINSFLKIRDPIVSAFVDKELTRGELWPQPLVQLNPSYKTGATVTELIQQNLLHPDCSRYFNKDGKPYRFYYHQEQAFRCAQNQEPYVLTTGTGSGKSMTYVLPIFDDLLRHPEIEGVRAILVYPMNALINSQKEEFDKFLSQVPNTHIRVEQYTGQEKFAKKVEIQNNPPQILLTNYVMLELMLSRVHEKSLVTSQNLKFLILDELHTYRGRQGADVAMLIRKLRQRSGQKLICIGTSATMSTKGSRDKRRQTVAEVASLLFGVSVKAENVIDETLERSIKIPAPDDNQLRHSIANLANLTDNTQSAFKVNPLSAWIEMNFGLAEEEGHLVRRTPISLETGTAQLVAQTQLEPEVCQEALKTMFLWGSKTKGLAFRLHQFISQGGSVYATIEPPDKRLLTLEGQYATTSERLLYPIVFCRECGQDYYIVRQDSDRQIIPMLAVESSNDDSNEGYLTLNEPGLWENNDIDRLPDTWFKETKKHGRKPKPEYATHIPQPLQVLPNGSITNSLIKGTSCWFIPKPFLTCLNCGVVHDRRKNEFSKLSRLSSEGRSTATTLLCLSTVNRLKTSDAILPEAAKILSFTDNRQDASLQAGHFNDFVQTSFLRAALNQALQAKQKLTHSDLVGEVVRHMDLPQSSYAIQIAEYGAGKRRNETNFHKLVEYRLYEDLRRGWRIVQPNLEQCGLLAIEYEELAETCADTQRWQQYPHPILLQATPQERYLATKTLLDLLRKELVVDAAILQPEGIEQLKRDVIQSLKDPWTFDPNERLYEASWASTIGGDGAKVKVKVKLTARSKIGRFLRSPKAWSWRNEALSETEYDLLINALINVLCASGFLKKEGTQVQLLIVSLIWQSQKVAKIPTDPLTSKRLQGSEKTEIEVNQFFQNFYQGNAQQIHSLEGREHTGQVSNEDRQKREEEFRNGQLASLFCSPTMELGIDISDLNAVHLRNVPPTPANYAQRSGRAGRSGQEALVLTYASVGSGHDQYFFKRQAQMVAGVVAPPKLELGNQDLIKSHIYSIWLAKTGQNLGESMNQILELELDQCPLKDDLRSQLTLSPQVLTECQKAASEVLVDLKDVSWYSEAWLSQILANALNAFDRSCDRWRKLYLDADLQLTAARNAIDRSARGKTSTEDRKNAETQEREARRQIDLLVGRNNKNNQTEFEFYPYRYFAAEGFLPGYNFPRLPVRTYVPAGEQGRFLSRPRVVAIREFAPGNIVYYEGSKFQIAKTKVPINGIESSYQKVSLCPNCGYFHTGDEFLRDTCENCGAKITEDRHHNPAKLNRILEMGTMITQRRERITCDEEERLKYGYNITTHFRYASKKQETATVTAQNGTPLLKLTYGETAQIWRINRGLRRNQQEQRGFKLDATSGIWGDSKNEQHLENLQTDVHLMVNDTCNVLVIEPVNIPVGDAEAFLATFQNALEQAIQAYYKLENDELASERLGQGQHLLFWEAAEGGAGVLSQILENPQAFELLAIEALDICHFQQPKPSCSKACYQCLLSYRNQFDHPLIDRYLIRSWLDLLNGSQIDRHKSGVSREEQYQYLRQKTDPNSEFERVVLEAIYQQGLKLPDAAQELIEAANSKPDFIYKEAQIAIFCDGSAHDHPEQQARDKIARDNLNYISNYYVLTFRYDEDLQSKIETLATLI